MNRVRWIDTMQARRLIQATPPSQGHSPANWCRNDVPRSIRIMLTTPPDEDNEDGVPEDLLVHIAPPIPGIDHTRPATGHGRHRGVHRPWWRTR